MRGWHAFAALRGRCAVPDGAVRESMAHPHTFPLACRYLGGGVPPVACFPRENVLHQDTGVHVGRGEGPGEALAGGKLSGGPARLGMTPQDNEPPNRPPSPAKLMHRR